MADKEDFLLESYDYELPESQIAQTPPEHRGDSRLMSSTGTGISVLSIISFPNSAIFCPREPSWLQTIHAFCRPASGACVPLRAAGWNFFCLRPFPLC